ncbi:MAG: glucose-1-phosphate cytidylyltransferase [Opitutae bacterium]|jgi:glucose-1-phosphate cytidylyltransferase|nr:glucose-1-phosphate cytidylyltransferase [Opitutae bacterium]
MKVVILAGGLGTRLAEETKLIPKPMVPVGGRPLLWHIMHHYARYDHKDFFLALGFKAELIKEYFLQYRTLNADFTVDLGSGSVTSHQLDEVDWSVTLVDTGLHTMTGGRVKRLESYIGNEAFLLTYGDGVADIDLDALLDFHRSHGKMVTVTAVHPVARFGELEMKGDKVVAFREKAQTSESWINGGYFIIEPDLFDLIENDQTTLEREPLERAAQMGELMAYHHEGYWQCMDTKRDHEKLEKDWSSGSPPWSI